MANESARFLYPIPKDQLQEIAAACDKILLVDKKFPCRDLAPGIIEGLREHPRIKEIIEKYKDNDSLQ